MNPELEQVNSIWDELRARLECEEKRINEEISSYPVPVAGCDQQFNYLLEQRANLPAEKTRLSEFEAEGLRSDNPIKALEAFLLHSTFIDDAIRRELDLRLQHLTTNVHAENEDPTR